MSILSIKDLHATVNGKEILKGLTLEVQPGEVHAIMGPNGAGKSTLGHVLAGREGYEITGGEVKLFGRDLTELETEERAREGLFLAFQYPVEIPGVSNMEFLKAAVDAKREFRGEPPMESVQFLKLAREKCRAVSLDEKFLKRGVNEGFSGGEKKRNELMQMLLLDPKLAVLDETDSGLDIDALQVLADSVKQLQSLGCAFILVTHYERLLDYIHPDQVHVLADGRVVKSGDKGLAREVEEKGYGWLTEKEVA